MGYLPLCKRFRLLPVVQIAGGLLLAVLLSLQPVHAQSFLVQGTVLSGVDATPLPGVNIVEQGTMNGTTTDGQGRFRLHVAGPEATLVVSFVGYVTQILPVNNRAELEVTLAEDVELLEEVVVTAFGIERRQRSVGYAVSEVRGESLTEVRENNLANALSGKIAGVSVSKPATGPAGSSRVIIRGVTSLAGENQPLYVVDGVPIDNTTLGSAGKWGGVDMGDGISAISPDDIETISVLKGAAAAALYGSRAQHGVVLITTKSGRVRGRSAGPGGLGVEFNSNLVMEDPLVSYSDYQTDYGQGVRGRKPADAAEAMENGLSSWGARLDGSSVVQFDGVARPYTAVGDKLDRFYRSGLSATNTLALTGSTEHTSFRFSVADLNSQSIVPNSGMRRTSLSLRGTSRFGRLNADVKVNYITENVSNRTMLSDAPGNPNYTVAFLPVNIDPESLSPGWNADGSEKRFHNSVYITNPYWAAERFVNDDGEDRVLGFVQLGYELTSWLTLQGRTGTDWYATRRTYVTPYGTAYRPLGSMTETEWNVREDNTDLLLIADRQLHPDLRLNATLGGSRMYRQFENLDMNGNAFNIPFLNTIGNTTDKTLGYGYSQKQINSLFGSAEVSFRDYLFLTVTGRNDWSSTLPDDHNAYFYPSVSGSFVFSDVFQMPAWLSFGKVRASWAQVGGDTDPYMLNLTYALHSATHLGQPIGFIAQPTIPLSGLKPSSSTGTEAGLDLRFLDGRFGLDVSVYRNNTIDQILSTTISGTSGFESRVINAGEMRNTGLELVLRTTPVRTGDLRWDLDVNYATNRNEVVSLAEEQTELELAQSRRETAWVFAEVGEAYGAIKGFGFQRDAEGNIIHDASGLPLATSELVVLGNAMPDWTGGVLNTLRYKNLMLSALVDIRWGGEIFSGTNSQAYALGLHKETLPGREACDAAGYPDAGCFVGQGVDANGNPNTVATLPETYYGRIGGRIAEPFVYDASYVKLRELQIGYRLPASLFRRTPIQLVTVSLVGRNLAILHKETPNIDPESNFNNTNAQGLELAGVPQTRSWGFNLSVRL